MSGQEHDRTRREKFAESALIIRQELEKMGFPTKGVGHADGRIRTGFRIPFENSKGATAYVALIHEEVGDYYGLRNETRIELLVEEVEVKTSKRAWWVKTAGKMP